MRVNIIVPVYNTESFLNKCLDSIFRQTYKDIFVICINDGSSDGSSLILNEYKKQHENMVVVNKKNGGLASARNAGLNVIKDFNNCYITFIDSDDYVNDDYIEKLVEGIEKDKSDIYCSLYNNDIEGKVKKTRTKVKEGIYTNFEAIRFLFSEKIQSHSPCKLYKGFLWSDSRFDENYFFMEDQAITYQIFLKANKISLTNWGGYNIVHRQGSLCKTGMSNKRILVAIRSYYGACVFDYSTYFDNREIVQINKKANGLFAKIFLMMYERFNSDSASNDESIEWNKYCDFVKKNKIIKRYHPRKFKDIVKKILFVYFHSIYKKIYKIFKKNK